MELFRKHEIFEIEVLERLKNKKFLDPLVFGGGTMLRLCHDLPRYSADLDLWFLKETDVDLYFKNLNDSLTDIYTLTDARIKHNTLLFEIRSTKYPRRLKIEIRKILREWDYQEKIAYSKYSNKQVIVKAHTLEQTMANKVEAILERKEIRDGFDIEFLLRRGINFPALSPKKRSQLRKIIEKFSANEFRVTLGSVLESDSREYYIRNRFTTLLERLT
jgi:predicted nucleotidyltransferase component of viral defense system